MKRKTVNSDANFFQKFDISSETKYKIYIKERLNFKRFI